MTTDTQSIEIVSIVSVLKRGRYFSPRKRYYFRCPGLNRSFPCRKRVSKLYMPRGEDRFACRECHDLTYRACKEHEKRVDALRKSPEELVRALDSPRAMERVRAAQAGLSILNKTKKLKR